MDKRQTKRIKVRHLARLDGKLVVVNDASEEGIQISSNYMPSKRGIIIALEILGKTVSLRGIIKWVKRMRSANNANQLGVIIKNPPPEYKQWVITRDVDL